VRSGINALIEEDWTAAEASIERGRSLWLLRGGAEEVAGLLELTRGDNPLAEQYFAEADAGLLRLSGLGSRWPVFLRWHLERHGNYQGMDILCRYLQRRGIEDDELSLLHGCALCGLHRLEEAKRLLAPLDRPGVSPHKDEARRLLDLIDEQQRRGRFVSVVDRSGIPLAELDLESRLLKGIEAAVGPLVGNGAGGQGLETGLDASERNNVNVLTIDGDLQRAAHQALEGKRGALVAIDPVTGDLLAVAANGDDGGLGTALERMYEPASVIKLITMAAALREGSLDRFELFPFDCSGNTGIEGKVFYDWRAHGRIPHVEHAMAVSCNLVFARMGQLLGKARVVEELERFGFGARVEQGPLGILPMALGQFRGDPRTTWDLSKMSVGLDHLESTPLHLALIAAAIANQGEMMKPRLLLRRENILGEVIGKTAPESMAPVIEAGVASALTDAMFEVVESGEGTGRRAAIDGLDLALKTGTGGDRKKGLDAVVVGFAPAGEPRVAFCVLLEGAGKAEIAAARATKLFVEAILYKLELVRASGA
jgi:peptidoglycan glycosyltransferase